MRSFPEKKNEFGTIPLPPTPPPPPPKKKNSNLFQEKVIEGKSSWLKENQGY